VINKLENTKKNLKSLDQLQKLNPKASTHSVVTKNSKLSFESYKEKGDESDPLVDFKADIIAAVFYERFKVSEQSKKEDFLAYHRMALANALKLHVKQYFEPQLTDLPFQIQNGNFPNSSILGAKNLSSSVPELYFSDYSNRLNDTTLHPSSASPKRERKSSLISRRRSLGKIPESEEAFSGSSSPKNSLERSGSSSSSNSNEKNNSPRSSWSPQNGQKAEKTLKEIEPEVIAKQLSMEVLNLCESNWLYKHTKEKKYKEIRKQCEEKIDVKDLALIKQFKEKPKLGIISQEIISRILIDSSQIDLLSQDINRTFRYTTVLGDRNRKLFTYMHDLDVQDFPPEDIAQFDYVQEIAQFENFLSIIMNQLGDYDTAKHILDIWKYCVSKKGKDITNDSFRESIKTFLDQLLVNSQDQKNNMEYKLWLLLGTFSQSIFREPCLRLLKSLPNFKKNPAAVSNISIQFNLSPEQAEVQVHNTIELYKEEKNNQNFNLIIENSLCTNLMDFKSWSSKISLRAVPKNWKEGQFKNDVIKPLQDIGFNVRQGYSGLTLRKKSLSSSSLL
jgi:hypothetical protein